MVKSIPFTAIKAAVSIEQVMTFTGLPFKKEGATFRCKCPVHGGDNRSLTVTPGKDEGVFFCQVSKEGGDRIALYAHVKELKQYKAHLDIAEAFAPHLLTGIPPKEVEAPEEKPTASTEKEQGSGERGFRPLPYLEHENPAVSALGISPDVAKATGVGYSPRGVHRGRVAIPLRKADGSICGYLSITADTSVQLPPKWFL